MNINELDPTVADAIAYGIELRKKAWTLDQEAKALKAESDDVLKALLPDVEDGTVEGVDGTVTYYTSKRTTLDKAKLKVELANAKVPADIIAASFDTASKLSMSEGVRYSPAETR